MSKHERAWNILGITLAIVLVAYILWSAWCMVSGAAW